MDFSSFDKKRLRTEETKAVDLEMKVPEAKRTKTQEDGQGNTESRLLSRIEILQARIDALEERIEDRNEIIAEYKKQYPLRPPPTYEDTKWRYFRGLHRNCSDLNYHYKEEMEAYDRHNKPRTKDVNGKLVQE